MISKKYRALIERRLARLEKAVNEGMRCESLDDIDEMAHDWFVGNEWDEDDYWVRQAGDKFSFIQKVADRKADPIVDACCDAIGVDPDSPDRDIVENALANAADVCLADPGYWDDDDLEDEDDFDEDDDDDYYDDDMYESHRRKLEQRVRILERQLMDEGIFDGVKDVANKISSKLKGVKLSPEDLKQKIKDELPNVVLGITEKLDQLIGGLTWSKYKSGGRSQYVNTRVSGADTVTSVATGKNRDLPKKDNISVSADVDFGDAKTLKDCKVNYEIRINSNTTTEEPGKPITGTESLMSLLDPKKWERIAKSFMPTYNTFVTATSK